MTVLVAPPLLSNDPAIKRTVRFLLFIQLYYIVQD